MPHLHDHDRFINYLLSIRRGNGVVQELKVNPFHRKRGEGGGGRGGGRIEVPAVEEEDDRRKRRNTR